MGNVGDALSHHLIISKICDDLILINRNQKRAWAEATDLTHALGFSPSGMYVSDGTYADCKDADIVVLAMSPPYIKGMSRVDLMGKAAVMMGQVIPQIMESGFKGIFVVITNPVDSLI